MASEASVDYTFQTLLAYNPDISEEAALNATVLSSANFYISQQVIQKARSAPPVCRFLLNEGCYRSDCPYNHDVDSHTCIFWMRGRCGKDETCRFLHGFADAVVSEAKISCYGCPIPVSPSNRNTGFVNNLMSPSIKNNFGDDININSYAGAALKGKDAVIIQPESAEFPSLSAKSGKNSKTVKIPENLWNPHQFQNSAAFQIADPILRYQEVAKRVKRSDVMDLHFQSTKTVGHVLSSILPQKLKGYPEIWVVTGTGHHVGYNTHQKNGGVLEDSVISWLQDNGYDFCKGKDRNGYGGALLVRL